MKNANDGEGWPRGLRRERAAFYLGVSPSKFDQLRKQGKIPAPKDFFGVAVYCRYELDALFSEQPPVAANDNNEWDSVLLPTGSIQ
jgi:hypothetical protein